MAEELKNTGNGEAAEMSKYDCIRLSNQLCFPLYAVSKEIVKRYKPFLEALDLTYTQYIVMMVLWEQQSLSVKEIGQHLYLDSGTLTPVLKKLEAKGYVTRCRTQDDERMLSICITAEGEALKERAIEVPAKMATCVSLPPEDAATLYQLLYKILDGFAPEEE